MRARVRISPAREFLASMLIVLAFAGGIFADHRLDEHNNPDGPAFGLLGRSLLNGAAVYLACTLTISFRGSSANFVLLLARGIAGRYSILEFLRLLVAQKAGAITGALLARSCVPAAVVARAKFATPQFHPDVNAGQLILAEFLACWLIGWLYFFATSRASQQSVEATTNSDQQTPELIDQHKEPLTAIAVGLGTFVLAGTLGCWTLGLGNLWVIVGPQVLLLHAGIIHLYLISSLLAGLSLGVIVRTIPVSTFGSHHHG